MLAGGIVAPRVGDQRGGAATINSGHPEARMTRATTLGQLRASYQPRSVKQELRDNLIARLRQDDPFAPICQACRARLDKDGDATPITWIPRDRRYGEKLATPDITIADLIGEVDPIKVAEGRYLSDELTIHYGVLA